MDVVYLNGALLPRDEARVPVDDRGFLFGDGVYEVVRAVRGRLFAAEPHLARLRQGMRGIGIDAPAEAGAERFTEIAELLLRSGGLDDGEATVYMQVTRGAAPRAHHFPPPGTRPTVLLSATRFVPPAALRGSGAAAITHPDLRWGRCDLKTVNLLPSVLARQAAVAAGATEAILVRDGVVTEGAATNAFAVVDGELRTHPLCERILAGVTRSIVIELAARLGHRVVERPITIDELARAQELLVTGTTTDVLPIVRLDGAAVADGAPGPVTTALRHALDGRLGAVEPVPRPVAV